jgi:hypothetical protein
MGGVDDGGAPLLALSLEEVQQVQPATDRSRVKHFCGLRYISVSKAHRFKGGICHISAQTLPPYNIHVHCDLVA